MMKCPYMLDISAAEIFLSEGKAWGSGIGLLTGACKWIQRTGFVWFMARGGQLTGV